MEQLQGAAGAPPSHFVIAIPGEGSFHIPAPMGHFVSAASGPVSGQSSLHLPAPMAHFASATSGAGSGQSSLNLPAVGGRFSIATPATVGSRNSMGISARQSEQMTPAGTVNAYQGLCSTVLEDQSREDPNSRTQSAAQSVGEGVSSPSAGAGFTQHSLSWVMRNLESLISQSKAERAAQLHAEADHRLLALLGPGAAEAGRAAQLEEEADPRLLAFLERHALADHAPALWGYTFESLLRMEKEDLTDACADAGIRKNDRRILMAALEQEQGFPTWAAPSADGRAQAPRTLDAGTGASQGTQPSSIAPASPAEGGDILSAIFKLSFCSCT